LTSRDQRLRKGQPVSGGGCGHGVPAHANATNMNMIDNPDAENIGLPMLTNEQWQTLLEMVRTHKVSMSKKLSGISCIIDIRA